MAQRTCSIDGCDKPTGVPGTARGWCSTHYQRWQRTGDPLKILRRRNTCTVEGCDDLVAGHGWCSKHYTRWLRYGSATARMPGELVDGKRVCPRCLIDRSAGEFSGTYCRMCWRQYQTERRRDPALREAAREYAQQYNAEHAERLRAKAREWRALNPDAVRAQAALYRARRSGARVERFNPTEVFERDCWTCGICSSPIDPELAYPHPRSVSLDHVIPLSRRGEHSKANTQASHLTCNVHKWASLP